jgi:hypothetical protein
MTTISAMELTGLRFSQYAVVAIVDAILKEENGKG